MPSYRTRLRCVWRGVRTFEVDPFFHTLSYGHTDGYSSFPPSPRLFKTKKCEGTLTQKTPRFPILPKANGHWLMRALGGFPFMKGFLLLFSFHFHPRLPVFSKNPVLKRIGRRNVFSLTKGTVPGLPRKGLPLPTGWKMTFLSSCFLFSII